MAGLNPWVEFFLEVEEMRQHQRDFYKSKTKSKLLLAKSKLCEMKVDQLIGKLKVTAKEKGIDLTNTQNESH